LFRFLLALKSHPEFAKKPVASVRQYVQAWHQEALPFVRTREWAATWSDAIEAWKSIDVDRVAFQAIATSAMTEAPPDLVSELGYGDDEPTVRLVLLCRALQRYHGDRPFYLSCQRAGSVIGTDKQAAGKRLNMLEADGVIKLVSKGSRATHKASEFYYTGPME
jgi:hypothetical protein